MSSRFFEFPGRELFWRHRRDLRNTLIWVFLFSINPLTSSCGMQEKEAPRDLDISILVDRSKNRSFSSIEKERRLWSPTKRRMRTSDWNTYPVWVRIEAKEPLEPGDYTLELSYPGLERVVFFYSDGTQIHQKTGGQKYPFFQRDNDYKNLSFNFRITQFKTVVLYLKITNTRNPVIIQPVLWTGRAFQKHMINMQTLHGISYGLFLAAILFNLIFYLFFPNQNSLLMLLATAFNILGLMSFYGQGHQFLWPDSLWMVKHELFFIGASVTTIQIVSSRVIFAASSFRFYPGIHIIFSAGMTILTAMTLMVSNTLIFKTLAIVTVLAFLFILFHGIRVLHRGTSEIPLIIGGLLALILGVLISAFIGFGLIPYTEITIRSIELGLLIQTITHSAGVMILTKREMKLRIDRIQREKEEVKHRITGELHDSLGSELSTVLFEIKSSNNDLDRSILADRISGILDKLRDLVFLFEMQNQSLFNFFTELQKVITRLHTTGAINIDYTRIFPEKDLTPDQHLQLHRIFMECVSNILKHSEAKKVIIRTRFSGSHFSFTIKEESNPNESRSRGEIPFIPGSGLKSLKRRTDQIQGKLRFFHSSITGSRMISIRFRPGKKEAKSSHKP